MKLLLSGASAGTNFGDFLFAKMFQEFVGNIIGHENVYWYNKGYHSFSPFFSRHLNYNREFDLSEIDGLVYISGGYFCGDDHTFKDYLIRFLNYFSIGIRCIVKRIPYCIIGVEAAKSKNVLIDRVQRIIIKHAKVAVVRNQQSLNYIETILGKNSGRAFCTADSVFSMKTDFFDDYDIPQEIESRECPKLLLHCRPNLSQSRMHFEKIVPIVNMFLDRHPDYKVVLSPDQYNEGFNKVADKTKELLHTDNVIVYQYDEPIALCKVINNCDVIITDKLHVGIVGAHLSKSVISFSGHTEKISRLYKQLGIEERTLPLSDLSIEQGYDLLENYHNKKIVVPEAIKKAAGSNLKHLATFISSLQS